MQAYAARWPRDEKVETMTRSRRNPGEKLRTAKKRTTSSARWLQRQINDPYVKKAKADGYRSRAAYKLIELDEKFGLFKGVERAVDLGIAPGGWSQVLRLKCPKAKVVGIDLLPTDPIEGVTIFEMDFMADEAPAALEGALDGPPDLVLSDMAANTVGHKQTDHLRIIALCEAAAELAFDVLEEGGTFVAKVLAGGAEGSLQAILKQKFRSVANVKPPASRSDSSEKFVVATGYRGAPDPESDDQDSAGPLG